MPSATPDGTTWTQPFTGCAGRTFNDASSEPTRLERNPGGLRVVLDDGTAVLADTLDEHLRTSADGVRAIGDIVTGAPLKPVANREGGARPGRQSFRMSGAACPQLRRGKIGRAHV